MPNFNIKAYLRIERDSIGATPDVLYLKFKKHLGFGSKDGPCQHADNILRRSKEYLLDGELLRRRVLDVSENSVIYAVVVPKGNYRSFTYNGARRYLTMRRTILLLYHDSETMGGHPSPKDTLAKVSSKFWWPSLEADVRHWCRICQVCKLTKPTPALTAE